MMTLVPSGQVWKRVWILDARSENECGKMTFFGLNPTNPNQLTLITPPPRIPRTTPPLPHWGVWIHTFLWQLNLCLFCIELKNLLDITKKGTECHAYSVVHRRQRIKKNKNQVHMVLFLPRILLVMPFS